MISAELRRNLWLEISPSRLIVIPLILALILWSLTITQDTINYQFMSGSALILFGLICIIWGAHLASTSITEEAQAQTWDWQRLSSQTPSELMFGKLFGSTVLAWYGGAWCLSAYVVFTVLSGGLPVLSWLLLSVAGAISFQASAILLTLSTPPEQRLAYQQKRGIGAVKLLLILFALQSLGGFVYLWKQGTIATVDWFGINFSLLIFVTVSTIFFAGWAVFGSLQRLSTLLRSPTTPTPWLLFVVWCMVYFSGFTLGTHASLKAILPATTYFGITAYLTALILTWGLAWQEDKSPAQWRLWLAAWHNRQYSLLWQRTPRWIATLPLIVIALSVALLQVDMPTPWLLSAPLLLLLRDTAVLYGLYWTPERKRPQLAYTIYLLLVYALLPYLLSSLRPIFYPSFESPLLSISAYTIEVVLAVAFCFYRWRKYYKN